ncbi:MAG TPA: alpha/beta hydrolase, partial [Pyrinomonadaceae bacterium]|nr:alpha/beta hydrolase [Pyrinomonadaceae bacterium]
AEIETRYTQKIIGVGHSLGGILHFLAAIEKPELYKAIILLDAPIISRLSSGGVRILKTLNLMDRFTPSQMTRYRRNLWQSKREVYEHFKQKEKFAAFDETVLRDYAEHGTVETDRGLELFFKPSIEAKIYRSLPHNLPRFRGKLEIPAAYIGGTHSREAKMARLSFMRKHFPFKFYFLDGSHLFPLEKPQETAEALRIAYRQIIQQESVVG